MPDIEVTPTGSNVLVDDTSGYGDSVIYRATFSDRVVLHGGRQQVSVTPGGSNVLVSGVFIYLRARLQFNGESGGWPVAPTLISASPSNVWSATHLSVGYDSSRLVWYFQWYYGGNEPATSTSTVIQTGSAPTAKNIVFQQYSYIGTTYSRFEFLVYGSNPSLAIYPGANNILDIILPYP